MTVEAEVDVEVEVEGVEVRDVDDPAERLVVDAGALVAVGRGGCATTAGAVVGAAPTVAGGGVATSIDPSAASACSVRT
jgi:hypothetical protein